MTECDRLAGDKLDAQGVGEGVLVGQIDVSAALPACELAHKAQPDSGRFNYQLGRVYAALARDGDSMAAFQRAASLGYVRALWALGDHFEYVPPLDPARGKELLEQALAAGDVYATHTLGQIYYEGRGVSERSCKGQGSLRGRGAHGTYIFHEFAGSHVSTWRDGRYRFGHNSTILGGIGRARRHVRNRQSRLCI